MIYDALKRAGHTVRLAPGGWAPAAPEPMPPASSEPAAYPAPTSEGLSPGPNPAPAPPTPSVTPLPRAAARRRGAWPEMVGLYYNIAALRTSDAPVVLQFVASRPGEGTSAIAREFAMFAASEETGAVLLIDCSCRSVPSRLPLSTVGRAPLPSLADVVRAGDGFEAAVEPNRAVNHLHEARLADHPNSLLHTNPTMWADLLDRVRQRYRFAVLDCPAVSTNPDNVVLSRSCDGVVIVVEAETTRGPVARTTIDMVERFGGKVLGLAFNKRRFYIPRWVYRRL